MSLSGLVDVVNFNADASCLSAAQWMGALEGGARSTFASWLRLYVERQKRVSLGLMGATLADALAYNPEAVALLRDNPDVFEIVQRPFSHDVALLRTRDGFRFNVELGRRLIASELGRMTPWFLPPEFMLNNEQVALLAGLGCAGTFINPVRFKEEVRSRIPRTPYELTGVFGARLRCIPFQGKLTVAYIDALQSFDAAPWRAALDAERVNFAWRDGESALLLPDGLDREDAWLAGEGDIERLTVTETVAASAFAPKGSLRPMEYRSYPLHSFTAWSREMRMLGYIRRIGSVEERLHCLDARRRTLWLQAIGSDVLSAVEKDSPVVRLRDRTGDGVHELTLYRSERGVDGEECLAMLEHEDARTWPTLDDPSPAMRKVAARYAAISALGV